MATFKVTGKTYREGRMYEPGETYACPDEEVGTHCDSSALEPADLDTQASILVFAKKSKAAKRINDARRAAKEAAEKGVDKADKLAELKAEADELAAKNAEKAKKLEELKAEAAKADAKS